MKNMERISLEVVVIDFKIDFPIRVDILIQYIVASAV